MAFKMPQILIFGFLMTWIAMTAQSVERLLDIYPRRSPADHHLPCATHPQALGLENGKIRDSQLTQSSVWPRPRGIYSAAKGGRLNSKLGGGRGDAWRPFNNLFNRFKQWFQVDLGRKGTVTAIGTQGRDGARQWVKSYVVSYSDDGIHFTMYKQNGLVKLFRANTDQRSIVKNDLWPVITARFIRIHPRAWNQRIAMRVELYGCPSEPKPCESSPCKNHGVCINQGKSFSCQCIAPYKGRTCEEESTSCDTYEEPLGMENGKITDSQITASSVFSSRFTLDRGTSRLHAKETFGKAGVWAAKSNNAHQWLQIDLGMRRTVTAVATQGRDVRYNQWVKTYTISYSEDGTHFDIYKQHGMVKVFLGNTDGKAVVKHALVPPITARYIRFNPKSWKKHISMRVEIYGCFEEPKPCDSSPCKNEGVCMNQGKSFSCQCLSPYKGKTCEETNSCDTYEEPLGMENGKIKDVQITASSVFSTKYKPIAGNGRLNAKESSRRRGVWAAKSRNVHQWLQIDLGMRRTVTAVATQGRDNVQHKQWVKTYTISYSDGGKHFDIYEQHGVDKVFMGNTDGTTVVKHALVPPITARYIRFNPKSWNKHISMRVEIYGCHKEPGACDSSPCKNAAICTIKGDTYSCKCRPYFIGANCETELPNPCRPNPCKNGGQCEVLGNGFGCRCKPEFGGPTCEYEQSTCSAQGDPHYRSFDGLAFDFQGGCDYIFAQDCGSDKPGKVYTVVTKNTRCGWGRVTCVSAVTIYLAGYKIALSRAPRTAVINGVRLTTLPITRPGFVINNPSGNYLSLSTNVGLSVIWDSRSTLKVTVSGMFKGKTCGLCGNNNGNRGDDRIGRNLKCAPKPEELLCTETAQTKPIIAKCQLLMSSGSPFASCHAAVNPADFMHDCKYDACRCTNPMQCVCSSFAAYTKKCSGYGKVIDWRFAGTFLYKPLEQCAKTCFNDGEIFTECGSSLARTCRDLSNNPIKASEECVPGCQCPKGQLLTDAGRCVPVADCPCHFEGITVQPGESVDVGNCKTCTCNNGAMACVDDRKCNGKDPCESFPCKNNGICTSEGDSFSCDCSGDYQGRTCEELKPQPCDSSPCKNGGICTNLGSSFTCRCFANFIGATCETELPNPCEPNPCKNGGKCHVLGNGFGCRCKPQFGGPLCEQGQSQCLASGDPHYTSFDGFKFDFQGACDYIFAQDCGFGKPGKVFSVVTKNVRCGGRTTCVAAVTIYIPGYIIKFSRARSTAIVNGVRMTAFPITRPGFVIRSPGPVWLILNTDTGLTVAWNSKTTIKVTVSGKYKGKTCGLCGNNNGKRHDDRLGRQKCAPAPSELMCTPSFTAQQQMNKCDLMKNSTSPFAKCFSIVDPAKIINDCKYDACRCTDPIQCVCASFATYTKKCSGYGKIINWRYAETFLYKPLEQCAQTCKNPGEIFTECGSSLVLTCRDLSRDIPVKSCEECIPGCQCPSGKVYNDKGECVPIAECPCHYEGKIVQPGDSVNVGNCKTCTCNKGAMKCVDDRECGTKDPCESFPCKNEGTCSSKGDSFVCECIGDYQGTTCEELKPQPCDSLPCKNGGVCTNEGDSFSCECEGYFQGTTCSEPKPKPCDSSPCKNGATCTNDENVFTCKCPPKFVGATCEKEVPNPCKPNPCKNGGKCEVVGNTYSCRCKPTFGGPNCEYGQTTCEAHGDPHYTTFDNAKFNFQGVCDYVFAQDCSDKKAFTVVTKNIACGPRAASCTSAVTVRFGDYEIKMTRAKRTAIINGVKVTKFPIRRPGFVITNPTKTWLRLTTEIGLTVNWNCKTIIRVSISGQYKGKTCGLCGNNDGSKENDKVDPNLECAPKPGELECKPTEVTKPQIDKCDLMSNPSSPFAECHSVIDPTDLVKDCKYDTCRCEDPVECLCSAFASYTKQCSSNAKIINWRFAGTFLYKPLEQCAKQCNNEGEIFNECGSSCAQTCRDLSRDIRCTEECVPGCQCPRGQVLDDEDRCVLVENCPCPYEGGMIPPGESVSVGNCKTCTCNAGAMECVDDRECGTTDPCESFPCKNEGICRSKGGSFSCDCVGDFVGETCEVAKPQPCDSSPCKNGGVCTNKGDSFSCECEGYFEGETCEKTKPKPCDSSPCKNGGKCTNKEDSFSCQCPEDFQGETCEEPKAKPCDSSPCKNGGKCANKEDSFSCQCPEDYQGETCEEPKAKPCDSSPCKNGGKCTNKEDSFSCQCPEDYQGETCEEPKAKPCDSSPCKNGGKCANKEDSFSCQCPEDYQGETCEEPKAKPCDSSPCKNGGKCTNKEDSFSCQCPEDYQGETCEEPKAKPCDSSPCKNGGKCANKEDSFSCQCPEDYQGETCEEPEAKPCDSSPCKNGGECTNRGDSFSCKCLGDYKGKTCEELKKPEPCDSSPCENGGTCENQEDNYICKCAPDYFGRNCKGSMCKDGKLDMLFVVDGSGSVRKGNFQKIKDFTKELSGRFNIGKDKTRVGFLQFGSKDKTRYEFKLGRKNTLAEVDSAIDRITFLRSRSATGDALNRARNQVFTGKNGDRWNVGDVLILFTDGQTTEKDKTAQLEEAKKLKEQGVMIITVVAGKQKSNKKLREALKKMASRAPGGDGKLEFEAGFGDLDDIANFLIKESCKGQKCEEDEVVAKCDSSCALTCSDLSRDADCGEGCGMRCRCPKGLLFHDKQRSCVPVSHCPCLFEGKEYNPGEEVSVGKCRTCTCKNGKMECEDKEDCFLEPCDSSPCKNGGSCTNDGESFSCSCTDDFEGEICSKPKPKPCDSSPCENEGICTNEDDTFSCKCPDDFEGETCSEAKCEDTKLDLLLVVDGSGSVRKANFAKVKEFIKKLNEKFDVGPAKTRIALLQFGEPVKTKIEFNLDDKKTLEDVNKGVDDMQYLRSQTATGDALRKAREEVFNGKDGDRPDAPNVLILFTDGQATDKGGKNVQVAEAQKLKDEGVKVITVGMGQEKTIDKFRSKLQEMASKVSGSDERLQFEADFDNLENIANTLVEEACDKNASV